MGTKRCAVGATCDQTPDEEGTKERAIYVSFERVM